MEQLEAWMNIREPMLKEKNYGDNIELVEELLRRQDDFEKTVDSQSDKFKGILRTTLVRYGYIFSMIWVFNSYALTALRFNIKISLFCKDYKKLGCHLDFS